MIFILFKIEAHSWKFEYFSNSDSIDRSVNRWLQRHFSDQSYALFYDHLQQLTTTQNRANLMRNFRRPKHPSAIEFQPAPQTQSKISLSRAHFDAVSLFWGALSAPCTLNLGPLQRLSSVRFEVFRFAKLSWDEPSPPFFWGGLQNEKSTSRDRFEFPTVSVCGLGLILGHFSKLEYFLQTWIF